MLVLDIFWDVFFVYCVVMPLVLSPFAIIGFLLIRSLRRDMKQGKSLWQVLKEMSKSDCSFNLNNIQQGYRPMSSTHRLDDMNTSSRYVGLPNNVFTNR